MFSVDFIFCFTGCPLRTTEHESLTTEHESLTTEHESLITEHKSLTRESLSSQIMLEKTTEQISWPTSWKPFSQSTLGQTKSRAKLNSPKTSSHTTTKITAPMQENAVKEEKQVKPLMIYIYIASPIAVMLYLIWVYFKYEDMIKDKVSVFVIRVKDQTELIIRGPLM